MKASPAKVRPNDVCMQYNISSSSSSRCYRRQCGAQNKWDCYEGVTGKGVAKGGLCMQAAAVCDLHVSEIHCDFQAAAAQND
jgi:hypothetical protein